MASILPSTAIHTPLAIRRPSSGAVLGGYDNGRRGFPKRRRDDDEDDDNSYDYDGYLATHDYVCCTTHQQMFYTRLRRPISCKPKQNPA